MKDNWDTCFALMLKSEGGYSNNPHDPGGMTNLGVTHIDWAKWIGHEPSEAEMRALTPDDVKPLYKAWYWDKIQGDDLPGGLDYALYDFGVNSGPVFAVKILQQCLGIPHDGVVGPQTLKAIEEAPSVRDLASELCERRLTFLQGLPTWNFFGKGWEARVNSVESTAFRMV